MIKVIMVEDDKEGIEDAVSEGLTYKVDSYDNYIFFSDQHLELSNEDMENIKCYLFGDEVDIVISNDIMITEANVEIKIIC